jgi:hypothetical protein
MLLGWKGIPFAPQCNLVLSGKETQDFIVQESAPRIAIFLKAVSHARSKTVLHVDIPAENKKANM